MIRVYNTLSRTKEPFETVQPGKVGIYLCGPTVYKPSHIGHMVGPVIFDAVKRYLTYSGYEVTWVVNITDVDDKLIKESNRRGIPMPQLAAEMTADYMRNLEAMGVDTINQFPRATDNIEEIIRVHRRPDRQGLRLRVGRRRVFRRGQGPGLRQAQPPQPRGHARRRGRHGRAQAVRRPISPSGSGPSPASPRGPAPGAPAGPAGTSSAR